MLANDIVNNREVFRRRYYSAADSLNRFADEASDFATRFVLYDILDIVSAFQIARRIR